MGIFSALFGGAHARQVRDAKLLLGVLQRFDAQGLAHARVMANIAFAYVLRSAVELRDARCTRAMDALMNRLPLADGIVKEIKEVERYFDEQRIQLAKSDDVILVQVANGLPIWLLSWRGSYDEELKGYAQEAWHLLDGCDQHEFGKTTDRFLAVFEGAPILEPFEEVSQAGTPPRYM